jgi:hypothetical protein
LYFANNIVSGKFTINAGSSCNGFKVEKSLDSIIYTPLYDYPGICGGSGQPETQSFTDNSPTLNQVNFYRLTLNYSETVVRKIYVSASSKPQLIAYPCPITTNDLDVNFKLVGSTKTQIDGYIYNRFGSQKKVFSQQSKSSIVTIPVYDLENGIYLVWLTDGDLFYTTKFIVWR